MTATHGDHGPLENPVMWQLFLKRLSCGIDPIHDAETIHSFAQAFRVSTGYVMARMWTYYHQTGSSQYH